MKKIFWSLLCVGALFAAGVHAQADDPEEGDQPDVTARVSRVSFIRGEVQVRRDGSQDWEKAVLNLPVVEGDEIATGPGERIEVQLNIYTHFRLSENSYLKVVGLKDGAVALSLSEGTMTVRLTEFDKDSAFFEIDAPRTTVAIQKAGMYRVDAGNAGSSEVRVTALKDGEARVYAENSGFTLREGRTATVKIEGPYAGEWDIEDASRFSDEFDMWSMDRDATIAKAVRDAYYDKYYDRDIYGAEDLNQHGDWVYNRTYGYVWRPHRSAIGQYANWSPYRYGHWRWVPPYGWTWVNDEPWGWATYHHGRWIYDNGQWYWTPYGYVRRSRSWWYPALVGVTIIRNSICWYPLPHGYGYYNYNYYFGGWGRGRDRRGNHHGGPRGNWGGNNNGGNNNGGTGPTPTPSPAPVRTPLPGQIGPSVFANNESRREWFLTPPFQRVPPGAVVSTPLSSFGRDRDGIVAASPNDARIVLTKALAQNEQVRILPTYQELDGRVSPRIKAEKPRNNTVATSKPTGAATRSLEGGPMDRILQSTKIFGDRQPVRPEAPRDSGPVTNGVQPRKTGAVTRQPVRTETEDPVRPEPRVREAKPDRSEPTRSEPVFIQPRKPREERNAEPVRPEPRYEAPQRPREEKVRPERNDPPPTRSEPVRSEPPKTEAPRKSDPPPPTRSEPKPDKPAVSDRKRDN